MNLNKNKVIRLMNNNNYHIATKVVLLFIRLKIRFFSTSFIPYSINKTTLVATDRLTFYSKPDYLISNKFEYNIR